MTPLVVGISGCSGSGKTFFIKQLQKALGAENITIISQDNYYKTIDFQPKDANNEVNFDTPEGIDYKHLWADIAALKAGQSIQKKEYTFNNPAHKGKHLTINATKIIVVEGIFVFHYNGISPFLDYSIYIDVDKKTAFERRLKRDVRERNYTPENIEYQWYNHVLPAYTEYLLPYKNKCEYLVNDQSNYFGEAIKNISEALYKIIDINTKNTFQNT